MTAQASTNIDIAHTIFHNKICMAGFLVAVTQVLFTSFIIVMEMMDNHD
jgi:H+/Cl- antiporter ClcA